MSATPTAAVSSAPEEQPKEKPYVKCGPIFVCKTLRAMLQPGHYVKGLNCAEVMNMSTGKVSGAVMMYKSSASHRGIALNFCPFCGNPLNEKYRGADDDLATPGAEAQREAGGK